MGLKRAVQNYKDMILNEEASQQARDVHAMKLKVLDLLRDKGATPGSYEYQFVQSDGLSYLFPAGYLFNSLNAHLDSYYAIEIIEAYLQFAPVVAPGDTMIGDDQMSISSKLVPLGRTITKESPEPKDQYEALYQYVMKHTEDWNLIEPLIFDRGIRTLPDLIGILTVVKETGHTTMSGGSL